VALAAEADEEDPLAGDLVVVVAETISNGSRYTKSKAERLE
jgi:hypothetical protein